MDQMILTDTKVDKPPTYDILYEVILMGTPLCTQLFPGYKWAKRIDHFSQMRKVRDRERKFLFEVT